jgi:ATP-dependent RNA helicase DeaD
LEVFRTLVERMAVGSPPTNVAAAAIKLLVRAQGGERPEKEIPTAPSRPHDVGRPIRDTGRSGGRPQAGVTAARSQSVGRMRRGGREAGMARVYIGAGREAGIRPGDLVGAIANEAKVRSSVIGAIEIEEKFSIVDVPESMAHIIIDVLGRAWIKGRKVPVRLFRE